MSVKRHLQRKHLIRKTHLIVFFSHTQAHTTPMDVILSIYYLFCLNAPYTLMFCMLEINNTFMIPVTRCMWTQEGAAKPQVSVTLSAAKHDSWPLLLSTYMGQLCAGQQGSPASSIWQKERICHQYMLKKNIVSLASCSSLMDRFSNIRS